MSYNDANRDYFNHQAASRRTPTRSALELAKRTGNAILKHYDFDDESTEVMDFACGSGLLSQHLAPHAKSVVGVDISRGMVDLYNQTARNQGLLPDELRAVCVDILDAPGSQPQDPFNGQRFDVVTCASGYHHFESIEDITKALVSYLKPGGTLIVVDLVQHEDAHDLDDLFPDHDGAIVAHRGGFREETVVQAFQRAGLGGIVFCSVMNVKKKGHSLNLFLARGHTT
ncbi:hexaprenyldihydroxybenzoate methyltransferase [Coprinellus micaceus]|uniref:Hexaprenyldihydroxybenzoate methyltransferase n=1 Tax=Coprinellus micaceus TaxID=71717 RepID=A0A4Y7TD15_COPMI|nr:hexaprenyldihydroxybenzoate methyltransferase [Coprinellus micaceus]